MLAAMITSLAFPDLRALTVDLNPKAYLPDLIVKASLALMFSAFLAGAYLLV